jgi:hypothetical protein
MQLQPSTQIRMPLLRMIVTHSGNELQKFALQTGEEIIQVYCFTLSNTAVA